MGQWTITIHGTGCHHNIDVPEDANRMAGRFVKELTAAGHHVSGAMFTHGVRDDLTAAPYAPPAPQAPSDVPV